MWKGEKQAIITVIKQWKDREGQGTLGKQPLSRVPGLEIQMLMEDTDSMQNYHNALSGPGTHGILPHVQI